MFNYTQAVEKAKKYGMHKGFMPNDLWYREICEWLASLPEEYRMNLGNHTVVKKKLTDSKTHDVMAEYFYRSKLVLVYFPHKSSKSGY